MNQIDFHFNVGNRLRYACLFVRKVDAMGKSVSVWSSDAGRLAAFDTMLWTFTDLSFITHAMAGAEDCTETRIILSPDPLQLPAADILLLLDENVPPDFPRLFARFERVVDIVSSVPEETEAARGRYRIYQREKLPLKAYDLKRTR